MAEDHKNVKYVGDSRVPAEKHSIAAPSYSEFPGRTEPFWPNFLLKEWMVGAVVLIGFLVLSVSHDPPLGDKANPNNSSFIPLPDWYFLFLYQLLKYPWASGDFVVIGTVVVPGLGFGALLLAPFLDTGKERRPYRRPVTSGLMLFSLVAVFYLTWASMAQYEAEHGGNQGGEGQAAPPATEEQNEDENGAGGEASPGEQIWAKQNNCIQCHGENMQGNLGPSLTSVGANYSKEEIKDIIINGVPPNMPPNAFQGSDQELDQLAEYLASLE